MDRKQLPYQNRITRYSINLLYTAQCICKHAEIIFCKYLMLPMLLKFHTTDDDVFGMQLIAYILQLFNDWIITLCSQKLLTIFTKSVLLSTK